MSVRDKMIAATILLTAAVAAGVMGMVRYRDRIVDVTNYITYAINRETENMDIMEADNPKIAITFDDGPHPFYTEQLLDGLKERGVKATFFVTGEHAELHPDIIRRMDEEGA